MARRVIGAQANDGGPVPCPPAIARRLHDRVVQRLAAVSSVLESGAPLGATERLRCARELQGALAELRSTIVYGADERREPLALTVADAVERVDVQHSDCRVELHVAGDGLIAAAHGDLLYDFLVEAVRNAAKHARPDTIRVAVAAGPDEARVEVTNGGVRRGRARSGAGLGLRLLQADAKRVGATLRAGPTGASGWRAILTLPLMES